jgi:ankyrin repeat protein
MKTVRSFIAILGVLSFCLNASAQNPQGDVELRKAAQDGDVKAVNELIRLEADVNGRDKKGRTPLLWAAPARDNPLMIHILVANGADVNASDKDGDTALMIAASQSNAGNVKALLESGARVNAANKAGRTALMASAFRANLPEMKLLLANGADIKLRDKKGRTAYDVAKKGSTNYADELNKKRFAEALELLKIP